MFDGVFDKIREFNRAVSDAARQVRNAFGGTLTSDTAQTEPRDSFWVRQLEVKRKLGSGWFTKRLGAKTRTRRWQSLTAEEREIARASGWEK